MHSAAEHFHIGPIIGTVCLQVLPIESIYKYGQLPQCVAPSSAHRLYSEMDRFALSGRSVGAKWLCQSHIVTWRPDSLWMKWSWRAKWLFKFCKSIMAIGGVRTREAGGGRRGELIRRCVRRNKPNKYRHSRYECGRGASIPNDGIHFWRNYVWAIHEVHICNIDWQQRWRRRWWLENSCVLN